MTVGHRGVLGGMIGKAHSWTGSDDKSTEQRKALFVCYLRIKNKASVSLLFIIFTLRYQTRHLLPGAPLTWKHSDIFYRKTVCSQTSGFDTALWGLLFQLRGCLCILSDTNADCWQGALFFWNKAKRRGVFSVAWGKEQIEVTLKKFLCGC